VPATEELTALEATFLELEDADPSAHMHVGAVLVFDRTPAGAAPPLEALTAPLERAIEALPRYRERLSEPHSGRRHWPRWEPDPGFELASHVRAAALPGARGEPELLAWASEFFSHRLDRRRPLWELMLVQGLAGDRWALVAKHHQSLGDGAGSLGIVAALLVAPDAGAAPAGRPALAAVPDAVGHSTLWSVVGGSIGLARSGAVAVRHPRRVLERSRALAELAVRDELIAAPPTSLNAPIGERRRLLGTRVGMSDLSAIRQALGGTVNDVVLALTTAGLRELLLARDEAPPEAGLRAMVPFDARSASRQLALGDRLLSLFVSLPVAESSTRERYEHVKRASAAARTGSQPLGADTVLTLGGLAPPLLHAVMARTLFSVRLFNVTVTYVSGPPQPLQMLGASLRAVIPLVPLAAEHAVAIAALSYDGTLTIGINSDLDTVTDAPVIVAGIETELTALLSLAGEQPRSPGRLGRAHVRRRPAGD
jgi:diacylglycerol O-acyltransferase / wax synthase